jgi:hypothetical protein
MIVNQTGLQLKTVFIEYRPCSLQFFMNELCLLGVLVGLNSLGNPNLCDVSHSASFSDNFVLKLLQERIDCKKNPYI